MTKQIETTLTWYDPQVELPNENLLILIQDNFNNILQVMFRIDLPKFCFQEIKMSSCAIFTYTGFKCCKCDVKYWAYIPEFLKEKIKND
jgi:hypothetical protein